MRSNGPFPLPPPARPKPLRCGGGAALSRGADRYPQLKRGVRANPFGIQKSSAWELWVMLSPRGEGANSAALRCSSSLMLLRRIGPCKSRPTQATWTVILVTSIFLASDFGLRTSDFGLWTLDFGLWTLDFGPWTLDLGPWTLDLGPWTLDLSPNDCRCQNPFFCYLPANARKIMVADRRLPLCPAFAHSNPSLL